MPFIVLEGLDGAGKSTQLNKLISCISEKGEKYEYLHFPRFDAPFYGDLIARFLRGEFGTVDQVSPWLVALLFAGDRSEVADTMQQWLDDGKFVLTDRFVYSNIAYQCAKISDKAERDRLADWIFDFEYNFNKIPRPDVSLFLDVPFHFTESRLTEVRDGDDRSYLEGGRDIHESSLELQKRVRQIYLERAAVDPKLRVIDCSDGNGTIDTPDNNFHKILNEIRGLL